MAVEFTIISHLPVGTVTFMLTDIEGSTRLWESAPEAMSAAVARHYELLDAAIALHGGSFARAAIRTAWQGGAVARIPGLTPWRADR